MMRRDQATHLVFGHEAHAALGVVLHVLRFISGVHVYYALASFWSIPTCIMLMTGYSMIEFQGNMTFRSKTVYNLYLRKRDALGSSMTRWSYSVEFELVLSGYIFARTTCELPQ